MLHVFQSCAVDPEDIRYVDRDHMVLYNGTQIASIDCFVDVLAFFRQHEPVAAQRLDEPDLASAVDLPGLGSFARS